MANQSESSRARFLKYNQDFKKDVTETLRKSRAQIARRLTPRLEAAARRHLPPGVEPSVPPVLDLDTWPPSDPQPAGSYIPPEMWNYILEIDPICRWCNNRPSTMADRIHPLSRGGSSDTSNLVGACYGCAKAKEKFMPQELSWFLHPRT